MVEIIVWPVIISGVISKVAFPSLLRKTDPVLTHSLTVQKREGARAQTRAPSQQ